MNLPLIMTPLSCPLPQINQSLFSVKKKVSSVNFNMQRELYHCSTVSNVYLLLALCLISDNLVSLHVLNYPRNVNTFESGRHYWVWLLVSNVLPKQMSRDDLPSYSSIKNIYLEITSKYVLDELIFDL